MKQFAFGIGLFLASFAAQARVFDLTSEKLASYLVFNLGNSTVGKSLYENEANTSYTYSKSVKYNTGADFGLLYATSLLNYRFGFEILKPDLIKSETAMNGATEVYKLNSEVLIYAPKAGVEINLRKSNRDRSFLFGAVGTASLSAKNAYSASTIAPVGAHDVEMTGSGQLLNYGLGQEGTLTDTTTYLFEFGYRSLKFDKLKYKSAVTTFSGAKVAGETVLSGTSNRSLDLSGYYIAIGFRIYMY